jgi:hypothetical protein
VVHCKDLSFESGGLIRPPVGRGQLDYARFGRLLRRQQPDAPLILAHLRPEDIPAAKRCLESALSRPCLSDGVQ